MDGYSVAALAISVGSAGFATWSHFATKAGANYANATDLTLAVDRLFIEHPEIRPYFYESKPLGDAQDRNLVLAVAEFVIDAFECLWDMAKTYEAEDRKAWSDYFADMFASSPALREFLEDNAHWYPALSAWHADQQAAAVS